MYCTEPSWSVCNFKVILCAKIKISFQSLNFHNISFDQYRLLSPRLRGYCNRLRPSIRLLCYLLINHCMKFNQIWCVSYSLEWGMHRQFFLALPPGAVGRGQKVKYHLIAITKPISKIIIPNFVCVITN